MLPVIEKLSLHAGDIVLVDFNPVVGHEQNGTRPAIVLTPRSYNDASSYVLICPITHNSRPWPFKLALPAGLKVKGYVLLDQLKSVDRRKRVLRVLDRICEADLRPYRACLAALLGMTAVEIRK